jgi:hypothetical protein
MIKYAVAALIAFGLGVSAQAAPSSPGTSAVQGQVTGSAVKVWGYGYGRGYGYYGRGYGYYGYGYGRGYGYRRY